MSEHPTHERLLGLNDGGGVEEVERRVLLEHLSACATCRARWLEQDPSRVFSLLALEPIPRIPEEALERLSRNVNRSIDAQSTAAQSLPKRYVIAAIAAALLLAGFFGVELTRRMPVTNDVALKTVTSSTPSVPLASEHMPQPGIELIHSPGQTPQVLDLSVGGTQFVMIFDEALDI